MVPVYSHKVTVPV